MVDYHCTNPKIVANETNAKGIPEVTVGDYCI